MPLASTGPIELYYETFGNVADEAMLLIMGFGTQMTGWDDGFCKALAKQGFYVVRYDNRDVGLSTKVETDIQPDPVAAMMGDTWSLAYELVDLADDAIGLLDVLGIHQAHLVGASMGGMIAQYVTISHPHRVLSLTSIMATTGDPMVGQPHPEAVAALFGTTAPTNDEERIAGIVAMRRALQSPKYPLSDRQMRTMAERDFDRAYYPAGAARHLAAVLLPHDRTRELQHLQVPTLVIHGDADPLVDISGGYATAEAIPGAELMVFEGMGHDLPAVLWPDIVEGIVRNTKRATV